MESRAIQYQGQVIPFKKEVDLTMMGLAQDKHELALRETKAREYSMSCKCDKVFSEDLKCLLSGLSVCGMIVALYFIAIIL